MSATRHWIALDETVSRLLPRSGVPHARERFAHRAAALTDIYAARILKTIEPATDGANRARHREDLQRTHRALTAALARAWNGTDDGAGS